MNVPAVGPERARRSVARFASRSGFTLIELIVVLLILTLVAGATVPALLGERTPDDDLTAAARRVETLFRLARDSAVRAASPVTVLMDSATSVVWLLTEPTTRILGGDASAPPAVEGDDLVVLEDATPLELPPSVQLLLGTMRARFTFLPTGATLADSLVLRHGTSQLVLTLDPWTGDVVAR